ncbi:MAG: sterol desaturase family protein [Sandaracinaceae bacterium]|nr:sterol desaturase family protein [Myxococcales bacterium]MCB9660081.1 sterol desaturase family protein [Sandaracinaceae bacterium]
MQPIFYVIPFFIVSMLVEWRLLVHRQREQGELIGYTPKDTAASLSMGLGMLAVNAVAKLAALALYLWLFEFRLFDIPFTWWSVVLLIVAEDFCYYGFHRSHHEVRALWAAHVNHHSSTHYNLSTALRQSWTTPITGPLFWVPLPLLGFSVEMILLAQTISLVYQYWIHTELIGGMGWFEKVFNSPSHHRVHHGRNALYLDRNHGGILIIWDKLFGTFQAELPDEKVDYGLTTNIETYNPVRIAFHEWAAIVRDVRHAATLRGKLGAVFMPPGWREDGTGRTAKVMRDEAQAARQLTSATSSAPVNVGGAPGLAVP